MAIQAQSANRLYAFGGSPDGSNPQYVTLVMDSSGNLFGTTAYGGTGNYGTVFELVNSGGTYTEKILLNFNYTNGGYPYAGLIMDSSGNLYGTTYFGGTYGGGTVFELVNSGGTYTENLLYSFTYKTDGASPYGALIMDSAGDLFGTTNRGGTSGYGTVFELVNSSGSYTERTLYSFAGSSDGAYPQAGLVMDSAGNLYGTTTSGGGTSNAGTVFELVNSGGSYTEQVLHSFPSSTGDGVSPLAPLVIDASGNLYGTTVSGGAQSAGTVFELVNSSGTFTEKILYSFLGGTGDGGNPYGPVTFDSAGNLYGTTVDGGVSGGGTVFKLTNNSGTFSESVLYPFSGSCGTNVGASPEGGLILDAAGNLYGITSGAAAVFMLPRLSGTSATTITLASSANPVGAGNPVQFTANVTSLSSFITTGTVTFSEGSTVLSTQPVNCGAASMGISDAEALGIGTNTITAQYTPALPNFAASSTTMSQTVTEAGVAVTQGNNTLDGNQTIDGSVNATTFVGNGSGLTNLTASTLNCSFCIGNAQLGINYAASSSQGGPASNALMLGGFLPSAFQPAGSYATTGANLFTGNQSITGNLGVTGNSATTGTATIGASGTPIVQHLSMTFTPTFALKTGAVCVSQAFTFNGANDGDSIALGIPNARMTASDLIYTAWVSAANKVTIRACAFGVKPATLGSGAIRVDLWQH